MTELKVLSTILDHNGSIDYVTLLNIGLQEENHNPVADQLLLKSLRSSGCITGTFSPCSTVSITPKGFSRLRSLEQEAEQHADQKAEQDRNTKQAVLDRKQQWRHEWLLGIISALFGSILTLCIEHFEEILVLLESLSHWFTSQIS